MPDNPNHRSTYSFTVHISYCKRHQFELEDLPLARAQGWPDKPDMGRLSQRVTKLRSTLRQFLTTEDHETNLFVKTAFRRFGKLSSAQANGAAAQLGSHKGHGAG